MTKRRSAGLLLYRRRETVEVFLVHPGGPFWAKKDAGAWSLPKGEIGEGEDPLDAARREVAEETGFVIGGDCVALRPVTQKGGKVVHAWAVEADVDPSQIRSNVFSMEWPPRSGRLQTFAEIDRAAWFTLDEARVRILHAQADLLDQLNEVLAASDDAPPG